MAKLTKRKADAAWDKEYRKRMDKVNSDPKNRDDHLTRVSEMFNSPQKKNYKEVDL
ncbi:hypothetical protein [Candidatus Deferrimicrobium sp.]|uniref:hypothetical protein n=1 Tax=Candidatus Deferrimicrobium sp. TaxID=3060586 RepID=UPI00271DBF79|nr:hypothetical protein [Candidatus Deferrimicrobium sp.]MDO8738325.1 hypothetical protein [Candidatus Deferrimicrobium sp.]